MLSSIGSIFLALGKMCIASVTTLIGFFILQNWPSIKNDLESPMLPLAVIFCIAYVVGTIFVSVFSISANTIMQCFLVDTEVGGDSHGAKNRPAALESYIYLAEKKESSDYDKNNKIQ